MHGGKKEAGGERQDGCCGTHTHIWAMPRHARDEAIPLSLSSIYHIYDCDNHIGCYVRGHYCTCII